MLIIISLDLFSTIYFAFQLLINKKYMSDTLALKFTIIRFYGYGLEWKLFCLYMPNQDYNIFPILLKVIVMFT